ncbi:MAG: gamma-glutamyltransferase [Rhodospirillales bacterium]|nr:gamma-glutamyltransferase [Rhodospirillales bacterium]
MGGLSAPADPPGGLLRVAAVASCPAETRAAMAVLWYGSNAVDAAVAGAAMLAVAEPHDGHWRECLLSLHAWRVALTEALMESAFDCLPFTSPLAGTMPGAVAAKEPVHGPWTARPFQLAASRGRGPRGVAPAWAT